MSVVPKMERSLELMGLKPKDLNPRSIRNFADVMRKLVFIIKKQENEK